MERIGEYLLGRIIGEGGMGKVYEAEERLSRRRVALKVLRRDLAQSEEGRRLFLREMSILSHLDHPNIVRCLACIEADGQLVMVLEHLDGQTLRDTLRHEARLPWPRVVGMGIQIAAGLGAAHSQSQPIVHRDLKPENIMVLGGDQTKVMDFGIAKILDALPSKTVHTVGTLQYMSPEQIEGRTLDPRADLYSLGLVLYEMIGGQPPFASESPRQLLNLQCTQPPPRLPPQQPPVPPALEQLVYALLEKEPDRRPPNADAVRVQLEQLAAMAGVVVPGAMAAGPMAAGPMATGGASTGPIPTGPMATGGVATGPMATGGVATGPMATGPMATGGPATGGPMSTNVPGPPRSMGTIMLVEKAGQAQQRRDKVGLFVGLGVAVVLLVGAGGYFAFVYGGASSAEEATPAVPAAAPAVQVRRTAESADEAQSRARAEEIRKKAEAEREAARDSEAGDDAAGDGAAGDGAAGDAEAGQGDGGTPQVASTSGGDGGDPGDTGADTGEARKGGISSLFGRIRGEDEPEPEATGGEPEATGAKPDDGKSGILGIFDDESAPGAADEGSGSARR